MGAAPSSPCPSVTGYRAAASVNLSWYGARGISRGIYVSCKVRQTTGGSFFCTQGFNGGYMGIQDVSSVFGGSTKRVIFSLWDQGGAPQASYVGPGVNAQRFGGEGTGLQFIDDSVGWAVGEEITCLVIYTNQGSYANYAAFYNRGYGWKQIGAAQVVNAASFGSFYSFVEDFVRNGTSAQQTRAADFGPVWFLGYNGQWEPATQCRFSCSYDPNENSDAVDTFPAGAGIRSLASGGNLNGSAKLESTYPLAAGAAGPPRSLPPYPAWF